MVKHHEISISSWERFVVVVNCSDVLCKWNRCGALAVCVETCQIILFCWMGCLSNLETKLWLLACQVWVHGSISLLQIPIFTARGKCVWWTLFSHCYSLYSNSYFPPSPESFHYWRAPGKVETPSLLVVFLGEILVTFRPGIDSSHLFDTYFECLLSVRHGGRPWVYVEWYPFLQGAYSLREDSW